jgi:hypothetical protein
LVSQYNDDDLADQVLKITLKFTLDNKNEFTFPTISATYLNNTPSLSEGAKLEDSWPIPCFASPDAAKWDYKLPKSVSQSLKTYFECPQLANVVLFNQKNMVLYLNYKGNIKQPASGSYNCVVTVVNKNSVKQ